MRKWTYWLLGLAALLLVVLAVALLMNNGSISYEEAAAAEFSATVEDTAGVDIHSSFVVRFDSRVSAGSMRKVLQVEPQIELNYHQGNSNKEVQLVPNQLLAENTVYTFSLPTDRGVVQWAVQTTADIKVNAISPADGSDAVAADAEIVFTLNHDLPLDLEQAAEYFSITPAVEGSFRQSGTQLIFTPAGELAPDTVYTCTLQAGLPLQGSNAKLGADISTTFATAQRASWQLQAGDALFAPDEPLQFAVTAPDAALAVRLYAFADAAAFAAEAERLAAVPQIWQQHPAYATNIASLTPVFADDYARVEVDELDDGEYLLQLPALPQGFYLMCCEYGGELRQQLFQVSALQAAAIAAPVQTLVWVHDAETGLPVAATVTAGEQSITAAIDGTAVLDSAASYIISAAGAQLVLLQPQQAVPTPAANQRCLFLDNSIYAYNDTLSFWGMVRPADGSQLEWPRVSVYIFAADKAADAADALHHSYAALNGFVFGGEVVLPNLLPGEYQLQIWQSGVCLAAAPFNVGYAEAEAPVAWPLHYADGVFIAETDKLGQTLFWRAAADGISAVTAPDATTPATYGEVVLRDGAYLHSPTLSLYDAPSAQTIDVSVWYEDGRVTVAAVDEDALPVPGVAVLVRALHSADAGIAADVAVDAAVYNDFSACFVSGVTDDIGMLYIDDVALLPGEWQLQVTAIKADDGLLLGESVRAIRNDVYEPATTSGWQLLLCEKYSGLSADAHTQAVLLTSAARSNAIAELWQYCGASSWQATAAAVQLQRAYPQLQLELHSNNGHLLQESSGAVPGLADGELLSSVYAALLMGEVYDAVALADYLRENLSGDDLQRAQVLCALAALGEDVLPDIAFEQKRVADPRARAWLLLARWQAGDRQTALHLWRDADRTGETTLAATLLDVLSGKSAADADTAAKQILLKGYSLQSAANCGAYSYKLDGKNHRHAAGGAETCLILTPESGFQLQNADANTSVIFWQAE
ncbi:MAG: Ig-like domain-containing protein [Firmicutes bacterium]|nr:Ig-like domain-containing protein [Bacillota bacterium]